MAGDKYLKPMVTRRQQRLQGVGHSYNSTRRQPRIFLTLVPGVFFQVTDQVSKPVGDGVDDGTGLRLVGRHRVLYLFIHINIHITFRVEHFLLLKSNMLIILGPQF